LTDSASTLFELTLPSGASLAQSVGRKIFAQATAALTKRSLQAVRRALRDADLTVEEVKGVVMVGGSTRMPQVREAVAQLFGQPPLTNLNPDEVVALVRPFRPTNLLEIIPLVSCCCWM
jgi:Molecular chaperone